MIMQQDFKTSPFKRAALVKAKAIKRKRNAMLATIAVNTLGSLIGAFCVVYMTVVVFS